MAGRPRVPYPTVVYAFVAETSVTGLISARQAYNGL